MDNIKYKEVKLGASIPIQILIVLWSLGIFG